MARSQVEDIELGQTSGSVPYLPPSKSVWDFVYGMITSTRIPCWSSKSSNSKSRTRSEDQRQIEDRRRGYPRFSALIASHDHFYLCRRFSELRARALLLKQDRLSDLESRLQDIDQQETEPLYLSCCRQDGRNERRAVVAQIDEALADYDNFLIRNRQILGFETARLQAISSLKKWLAGTACIARAETAYLSHPEDLLSLAPIDDTVMAWLETILESFLIYMRRTFGLRRCFGISRDPRVHIVAQGWTARLARILMTPFIVILLLTPVLVCSSLDSLTARLATIVTAASVFVAVLSGSTKAKITELAVAGATYTAVLVVFVTSTNASMQ